MSYTNPKQYVDTQSAKSIMDLQRSVSDSYSSLAKQRSQYLEKQRIQQQKEDKEREKEDEANKKQVAKELGKYSEELRGVLKINSKKVSANGLINNLVDQMAALKKKNGDFPSDETVKEISILKTMPDLIQNSLEVTLAVYGDEYEEQLNNMGLPGGISKYNNDDSIAVGKSVTSDNSDYAKTLDLDEEGKIVISFINKDGFYKTWPKGHPKEDEVIFADVSSIESADTAIVIPDYSKTISAIDKDINEQLGIGREEGGAYRESNLLNKAGIPGETIYYKEADMDMIRKKYEKKIETEYFKNGAEGMIAFYNNIVPKESKEDDKVIENKKGKS
jgi:hypothetical protein